MLAKIITGQPEYVRSHTRIAVALAGKDKEIEAFVGLDKRICHAECNRRIYIIINGAGDQEQTPLQVVRQIYVRRNIEVESSLAVSSRTSSMPWFRSAQL